MVHHRPLTRCFEYTLRPATPWFFLRAIHKPDTHFRPVLKVVCIFDYPITTSWGVKPHNTDTREEGQTIQWPIEEGQTIQWPIEEGQTIQWPIEEGQTIQWPIEGQTIQWQSEKGKKDKQWWTKQYTESKRLSNTLRIGTEHRCTGRVNRSCSTSDTFVLLSLKIWLWVTQEERRAELLCNHDKRIISVVICGTDIP